MRLRSHRCDVECATVVCKNSTIPSSYRKWHRISGRPSILPVPYQHMAPSAILLVTDPFRNMQARSRRPGSTHACGMARLSRPSSAGNEGPVSTSTPESNMGEVSCSGFGTSRARKTASLSSTGRSPGTRFARAPAVETADPLAGGERCHSMPAMPGCWVEGNRIRLNAWLARRDDGMDATLPRRTGHMPDGCNHPTGVERDNDLRRLGRCVTVIVGETVWTAAEGSRRLVCEVKHGPERAQTCCGDPGLFRRSILSAPNAATSSAIARRVNYRRRSLGRSIHPQAIFRFASWKLQNTLSDRNILRIGMPTRAPCSWPRPDDGGVRCRVWFSRSTQGKSRVSGSS